MEEKKGLKILTARNGIALVAVLAILLILTLLIPVMFSMGESSLRTSVTGTTKQKVNYLARTGVEIGAANIKNSFNKQEYEVFYNAVEDAINSGNPNATYGITISSNGRAHFELVRVHLYQKKGTDDMTTSKYVSKQDDIDALNSNDNYEYVGYVDISIDYDNRPIYYKQVNKGTPQVITKDEAWDSTTDEIKTSTATTTYLVAKDKVYYISATAAVSTYKSTRKAALVKTLDTSAEDTKLVEYTGNTYGEAPEFYLKMNSIVRDSLGVLKEGSTTGAIVASSKSTDNGGNLCIANPYACNTKKEISYENPLYTDGAGYAQSYLYCYSTIGDMLIDCNGAATDGQNLALGTYPGIRYVKANKPSCNQIVTVNYKSYAESVQYANFVSYAASRTLQVNLPIDARVNPTRAGRSGDISIINSSANASLFKMINLEGKEIVLNGKTDLMISFYNPQYQHLYTINQTYNVGKRMGTIVLMAPNNSPYSYYNNDRGKVVKAGKVYFTKDVYIWLIKYGNDGSSLKTETVYNSGNFNSSSFTYNSTKKMYNPISVGDFEIYKLFSAGDVYYFNNEVAYNNQNVGVSLVNYFIETQYLNTSKVSLGGLFTDTKNWFATIRHNLFSSLVSAFADTDTYKADDMHYVGNITKDNIEVPDVEDGVYVVWDD